MSTTIVDDLKKAFNELPNYVIEIGVLEDKNVRKKKSTSSNAETNAEILYKQENGSPLQNIPARPVLRMAIEWAEKSGIIERTLNKCFEVFMETASKAEVEKELDKLCIRIADYAKDIIYSNDGRLAPNAESTILLKGFNHPLFVTGQLARSISARFVEVKK